MTRKSKQPGGHNPLTYHERAKLTSYGTTTARLNTESQRRFGDCHLGLAPAVDPVATPSGNIYSREAIVSYLLAKTQELKEERDKYEAELAVLERKKRIDELKSAEDSIEKFQCRDQGASQLSKLDHSSSFESRLQHKISTETATEGRDVLKRTSYWLSDFQPTHDKPAPSPPPARPPSPFSGHALRLKDLIPLNLEREGDKDVKSGKKRASDSGTGKVICAVSGKSITTQPTVAIKRTGVVVLKDVFEQLVKPTMTCPITGKKIKESDILELTKASSGYAASGTVIAKKYRPTLT